MLSYHDVLVTSIRSLHFIVDLINDSGYCFFIFYKIQKLMRKSKVFKALFPNILTLPSTSVAST
jgi:hypothetical protein